MAYLFEEVKNAETDNIFLSALKSITSCWDKR